MANEFITRIIESIYTYEDIIEICQSLIYNQYVIDQYYLFWFVITVHALYISLSLFLFEMYNYFIYILWFYTSTCMCMYMETDIVKNSYSAM